MTFGLEKYISRTFKQKDLDDAIAEEAEAQAYLESFDMSKPIDMKPVMLARDEWKKRKLRREEIEQVLKSNK